MDGVSVRRIYFSFSRYLLLVFLMQPLLSGCNAYDPIDNPHSDEQYISAARACFDQGDLTCAKDFYSRISASAADIKNSETAFVILDEQGIGMDRFLATFGEGGGGAGLSALANQIGGAGEAKRWRLIQAFQYSMLIYREELRGFVRFLTSMAVIAELLAEIAGDDRTVTGNDLVVNATACKAVTDAQCILEANCDAPGGSVLTNESLSPNLSTVAFSVIAGNPSIGLLNSAIKEMLTGLNEIGAGGKFNSGIGGFAREILNEGPNVPRCYRKALLGAGIGL